MLELSNFQIFFMVLHGSLLVFLVAYLARGTSSKKDNVISYAEMKKRRRKKRKKPTMAKTAPPSAFSEQTSPGFRDVREVREIRDLLPGKIDQKTATVTHYRLTSSKQKIPS